MALFLPTNVKPLAPASNMTSWDDSNVDTSNINFFKTPKGLEKRSVELGYKQL